MFCALGWHCLPDSMGWSLEAAVGFSAAYFPASLNEKDLRFCLQPWGEESLLKAINNMMLSQDSIWGKMCSVVNILPPGVWTDVLTHANCESCQMGCVDSEYGAVTVPNSMMRVLSASLIQSAFYTFILAQNYCNWSPFAQSF